MRRRSPWLRFTARVRFAWAGRGGGRSVRSADWLAADVRPLEPRVLLSATGVGEEERLAAIPRIDGDAPPASVLNDRAERAEPAGGGEDAPTAEVAETGEGARGIRILDGSGDRGRRRRILAVESDVKNRGRPGCLAPASPRPSPADPGQRTAA